jgi:hypothetical protein
VPKVAEPPTDRFGTWTSSIRKHHFGTAICRWDFAIRLEWILFQIPVNSFTAKFFCAGWRESW